MGHSQKVFQRLDTPDTGPAPVGGQFTGALSARGALALRTRARHRRGQSGRGRLQHWTGSAGGFCSLRVAQSNLSPQESFETLANKLSGGCQWNWQDG